MVWLVIGRDAMILSLAAGGLFWKGIRDFPPTTSGKISTLFKSATSLGDHIPVRIRGLSRCRQSVSVRDGDLDDLERCSISSPSDPVDEGYIPLKILGSFF